MQPCFKPGRCRKWLSRSTEAKRGKSKDSSNVSLGHSVGPREIYARLRTHTPSQLHPIFVPAALVAATKQFRVYHVQHFEAQVRDPKLACGLPNNLFTSNRPSLRFAETPAATWPNARPRTCDRLPASQRQHPGSQCPLLRLMQSHAVHTARSIACYLVLLAMKKLQDLKAHPRAKYQYHLLSPHCSHGFL